MHSVKRKKLGGESGFTLIELLIVVGVIAILAALVFVALNPLGRFQDSRNAQRWSDVNAIASAIKINQIDNGGNYLSAFDDLSLDLYYQIGEGSSCHITCPGVILQPTCVDLSELIGDGYLPSIPFDPNASGADGDYTHYYLVESSNGTITVGSCDEEAGTGASTPVISVTR